jgi:hypothetical protein
VKKKQSRFKRRKLRRYTPALPNRSCTASPCLLSPSLTRVNDDDSEENGIKVRSKRGRKSFSRSTIGQESNAGVEERRFNGAGETADW